MTEHCSNQVSPLSLSPLNNSVVFGYLVCHECLLLVSPRLSPLAVRIALHAQVCGRADGSTYS